MIDVFTMFWFLAGMLLGLLAALVFRLLRGRAAQEMAAALFQEADAQRTADREAVLAEVKASFGALSLEALSRSTEEFLKLAKTKLDSEREVTGRELEAKKTLIDLNLQHMNTELERVTALIHAFEKDRVEKFGELTTQLRATSQQTATLVETTRMLREALSSTKARGQWGERMAEDVLRLAGFLENVNYTKQRTIEGTGSRPDFTFLLPRDLRLNMDVKFPLDNYLKYLEATTETDRAKFRNEFLRDVKARVKEVTTRDYINPEQNTVDSVLLFIPNEQIYAFIHEQDASILDDALRSGVVFCSPVTLFAILAVVRKAVENFALEQTSTEILALFGAFKKQWEEFIKKLELVGKRITEAQKEYDALATTRRRQLEKPLSQIEELRTQRGLRPAGDLEVVPLVASEENGEHDRAEA